MGDDFFNQLRKTFILGSLFSGVSSLTKVFRETEDEIEDIYKYFDERVKSQNILNGKFFKNGDNKRNDQ